jgi:pyridoxamine 5'-phosphate oxidase
VGPDDGLADVRRPYHRDALLRSSLHDGERHDPLLAVRRWVDEAVAAHTEVEPNAMTLATVDHDRDGATQPDARVVLCKGIDTGLVFYTSRTSVKGRQLAATPVAAAVFLWTTLERQVRVRGRVEEVDDVVSDAYFASRPRGSRIGAWTSQQSAPVPDRAALEARADEVAARFDGDRDVPRPPTWGGYRLLPDSVELWQGRPDRLHDRLRWRREGDGWQLERLQP